MRVQATIKRRGDRQANGTPANAYDRHRIRNRRHRRRRHCVDGAADPRQDYSPDPAKLLDAWLGRETGQRAAALVELGMANLGELLTSTRANAHHATQNYFSERYATQDQGKGLAGRLDQLRLRIDRLEAKLNRYQHPETPD